MRLIEDDRIVMGYLNYDKLTVSNVDPFTPMGPNMLGEWCWPVEAEVNENGAGRIGFSFIEPEEL